jgi:DNA polymerase III epsilon subunit-like protein
MMQQPKPICSADVNEAQLVAEVQEDMDRFIHEHRYRAMAANPDRATLDQRVQELADESRNELDRLDNLRKARRDDAESFSTRRNPSIPD